MTNKEAIKNIVAYMYFAFEDIPAEVGKAFDLAIKALEIDAEYEQIYSSNDLILYRKKYSMEADNDGK